MISSGASKPRYTGTFALMYSSLTAGLVAEIMYLEQQEDDTAIAMIAEEQPEQLRQFSHRFNRMFRGSLETDDIEIVNQLTEVKTMLAEVVDQIEKRGVQQGIEQGMQQGMQKKARDTARKMLSEGLEIPMIARITGLSEQEINKLEGEAE